jgi:hypothetical protein
MKVYRHISYAYAPSKFVTHGKLGMRAMSSISLVKDRQLMHSFKA